MARKSADCFKIVAMERTRISWVIFACVPLGFSARKTYWGKRNSVSSVPAPSREFCRAVCLDWPLWRSANSGLDLLHGTWTRCAEEPWEEMWFLLEHAMQVPPAHESRHHLCPTLLNPKSLTAGTAWFAGSQYLQASTPHSSCGRTILATAQPLDRALRVEVAKTSSPHWCWSRRRPDQVPSSAQGSLHEEVRWSISLQGTYPVLWPPRMPGLKPAATQIHVALGTWTMLRCR